MFSGADAAGIGSKNATRKYIQRQISNGKILPTIRLKLDSGKDNGTNTAIATAEPISVLSMPVRNRLNMAMPAPNNVMPRKSPVNPKLAYNSVTHGTFNED